MITDALASEVEAAESEQIEEATKRVDLWRNASPAFFGLQDVSLRRKIAG